MARRKETVWQRDFSFGAVRPEAVERDDTDLIDNSVKEALNTIVLSTGQVEARPGTMYVADTTAEVGFDVNLGANRNYHIVFTPTGYVLYDDDASVVTSSASIDWTAMTGQYGSATFEDINFWVVSDPDSDAILIGASFFPIQVLQVSAGTWSFGPLAFETDAGGSVYQPYYNYYSARTIRPSALTGSITVTAPAGIWSTDHEGVYIRYNGSTILLDTYVSDTVMDATVIEELPPTFDIVVAAATGYREGDAVEDSVLGGTGIITNISGTTITVLVTAGFDGFAADGTAKLVAPNAAQVMSSVTAAATKAATTLWDIQLMSPVHGYAGCAARHKGRLYLGNFPRAQQLFAASSAGAIDNFFAGPDDADGFVEAIGSDSGGALRYIVSSGDLLFLTSRGLYYQLTRDGSAVTPLTIAPISFSQLGVSTVRPVQIDEGVVFVDQVGRQVYAAITAGDVYRSWQIQAISKYAPHLIGRPLRLGATTAGSEVPEQLVFVINRDDTVAVCQWDRDEGKLSWRPWTTDGTFVDIYSSSGQVYAIVDRTIDGVAERFLERFAFGAMVDCMAAVRVTSADLTGVTGTSYLGGTTARATHLAGHTASVYFEGWDYGDLEINGSGRPLNDDGAVFDYASYTGWAQIGLNFTVTITPWARRSVNTQKGLREVQRLIEMYVTVQQCGPLVINGQDFANYLVGEDTDAPPALRDRQYRLAFAGGDTFEEVSIVRERPGPVRLLKIGYRVVI